jgi:hypothetical protein
MGGQTAAFERINSFPGRLGRVAVLGSGFGLNRPWLGQDYSDSPLFLRIAGPVPVVKRMQVRLRASGIRWIAFEPQGEFYAFPAPLEPPQDFAWYRAWAELCSGNLIRVWPTGRAVAPDDWYVFELRAGATGAGAASSAESSPALSETNRRRWEERQFGAYGVYWYYQAMIAWIHEHDEERTVASAERAFRYGRREAFIFQTLSAIFLRRGRFRDAAWWAQTGVTLRPGDVICRMNLEAANEKLGIKKNGLTPP